MTVLLLCALIAAASGRGDPVLPGKQPPDFRNRPCRAEQIALHFRAAQTEEHSRCCSVSTPSAVVVMFRALAMLMTACTIGDEPWAPAMSLIKASVDLDLVEWKPLQIAQRRIAGSEIVQRDTHADGAKVLQHGERSLVIANKHRFGNLEFKPVGGQTGGRQRIGDLQRKCVTPELHRRNVDRELNARRPVRGLRTGGIEHPVAYLVRSGRSLPRPE